MRLAVAATPGVAIPTLEHLLTSEHQLVRIFTTGDKPVGRGRSPDCNASCTVGTRSQDRVRESG